MTRGPILITIAAVAAAALGGVAVVLAAIYMQQRSVLFPAPAARGPSGRGDATPVTLGAAANAPRALYLRAAAEAAAPVPVLIFAHGNGELADDWVEAFGPARAWGWAVLLLEYPGYGDAPGAPSEASIRAAALAAFDWAAADPRHDPRRIAAYGRSLGGGAAVHIAATRPVAALILESAFTSTRPLAAVFRVPGWLVRDPFDNLASLERYRGPLLVVHGQDDTLVPVAEGRALAAAVPGAELHVLPCGHNDCPRPWPIIEAFLDRHQLLAGATR